MLKNSESTKKDHYKAVYPNPQEIVVKDGKTYVTNLKVLLAQNLYNGKKMIKLNDKLSELLKIPEPPIGWYISEKYDGIRAIWDGEKFISRGQKVFTYVPEYFKLLMPPGIALDGEIWISRNNFKEASRLSNLKVGSSKSQAEIDKLWRGTNSDNSVKYMVYDIPDLSEPFETRMEYLQQIVENRKKIWEKTEKTIECPLRFTKQTKITSMEQLISTYNELTSQGAEGVMLRAPNSPYETKRSKYLLKYKIKEDAEALVIGYTMGTGKYTGLLGSLQAKLILNNVPTDITFNIGTGLNDKDRAEYNNPKSSSYIPIGSIVSFSYMELSEDSVPRHPVYRGIRDDVVLKKVQELQDNLKTMNKDQLINCITKNLEEKSENKKKSSKSDYKSDIIESFKVLIQNEEAQKEPNWQFKRKAYKQVIDILTITKDDVNTVDKALEVLRAGGAKLEGEEKYYAKNGEYKSRSMQKIDEIIKTGSLAKTVNIKKNPKVTAINELSKIAEIGPAKANKLYSLGITSIKELNEAYKKDNTLLNNKQSIGLKYHDDLQLRIPRAEMNDWNKFFNSILKLTIEKYKINSDGVKMEMVGSYRRQAESSGDIDILLTSGDATEGKKLMTNFIKELMSTEYLDSSLVFSAGNTKFMGLGKIKDYYRHIDIFYYSQKQYPFALLFSTGSAEFNVEMRADALKKGYSLNEKELAYRDGSEVTSEEYLSNIEKEYPTDEKDIFNILELKYIEPKNRKSGKIISQ